MSGTKIPPTPDPSPPRASRAGGGENLANVRSAERDEKRPSKKTVALALGGGGARGFAHIVVLEVLDDLGIRPSAIAGSSVGAAIGAAYAAGMSGRAIRRYVIDLVHDRAEVFRRLFAARAAGLAAFFPPGFGNPMLLNAEKLCGRFLPDAVPETFEQLVLPLTVLATDLYGRHEVVFDSGRLKPAIAASMTIPGLVRPLEIGGRVLVDGAAVNPLPFDCLRDRADIIVAVDTSVGPVLPRGIPDPWEALFSTIQVMGQTIIAEKLKHGAPDILVRPNVGTFRLLDFLQASAILRAADPVKAEVRSRLAELIGR